MPDGILDKIFLVTRHGNTEWHAQMTNKAIKEKLENTLREFESFPLPDSLIENVGEIGNARWYQRTYDSISEELDRVSEHVTGANEERMAFMKEQLDRASKLLKMHPDKDNWPESVTAEYDKIIQTLGETARITLTDEIALKFLSSAKSRFELLTELLVSVEIYAHNPEYVASFWLDDDYYIGGRAVNSVLKTEILMHLTNGGYDFIEMVKMNWSSCDDFHGVSFELLRAFINSGMKAVDHLDNEEKDWFNGLEDDVIIYRGAQSYNQQGLSWTTDSEVAKKFALHARGVVHDNPRIVTGKIKKDSVFYATNARKEYELVVNFNEVQILDVEFLDPID